MTAPTSHAVRRVGMRSIMVRPLASATDAGTLRGRRTAGLYPGTKHSRVQRPRRTSNGVTDAVHSPRQLLERIAHMLRRLIAF